MGDKSSSTSTIKITKRENRSIYSFLLQHLIRPFKDSLLQPGNPLPAGSPQLAAPKATTKTCNVGEHLVEGIYIYTLHPRQAATQKADKTKQKRLYYFCGGSWLSPPSGDHWTLCTAMARELSNVEVSIVSSPLAPNSPAPVAFPQLIRMYGTLLRHADDAGEDLILGGDSSGGNLVLCLALQHLADNTNGPTPKALMAICPSVDFRDPTTEMREVEKHDPLLRIASSKDYCRKWRAQWSPEDPRVTPLNADVSLLARRGVEVHGVVASYDILSPDAKRFREQCTQVGVKGEWLDWDKQMHCFPLAWKYHLPESVQGKEWIIDILRRV